MNTLSLRSLSMLFKYYRRPVLTLFAITGAGMALAALSKLLPWHLSFLGSRTILMLVMIFSPLAFRSDTGRYDVDAMLPTTTATRFTAMFPCQLHRHSDSYLHDMVSLRNRYL